MLRKKALKNKTFALEGTFFNINAQLDSHYENGTITLTYITNEGAKTEEYKTDSFKWENWELQHGKLVVETTASPKEYTVSFNTGKTGYTVDSQTVQYQNTAHEPKPLYDPENREIIQKWQRNGEDWDFNNFYVESDITLVAVWASYINPTKLIVEVPEHSESDEYLSINYYQAKSEAIEVTITDSSGSTLKHKDTARGYVTYQPCNISAGKYTIELRPLEHVEYRLGHDIKGIAVVTPASWITSVEEFAYDLDKIDSYAFCNASNLREITLTSYMRAIEARAFSGCSQLSIIKCEKDDSRLEIIGNSAFNGCISLANLDWLPTSVTTLGESAFQYSGITKFSVTPSIKKLGQQCFSHCAQLSELTFAEKDLNLTTIPVQCFEYSGLKSVFLPEKISTVGAIAFGYCDLLEKFTFANEGLATISGVAGGIIQGSKLILTAGPYDATKHLDEQDYNFNFAWKLIFPDYAFGASVSRDNCLKAVTLPDFSNSQELPTTQIFGQYAFNGLKLASAARFEIPRSAKSISIGEYAFSGINAQNATIVLPNTLEVLGKRAFSGQFAGNIHIYRQDKIGIAKEGGELVLVTDAASSWFYNNSLGKDSIYVKGLMSESSTYDNFGSHWRYVSKDDASQVAYSILS